MSKCIHIIYFQQDKQLAKTISKMLSVANYNVSGTAFDNASITDFLSTISPDSCQLIISVNMAGFAASSSDGGASFNITPINVLVYLSKTPSFFDSYLSRRINYTMHFIVSSPEEETYIKSNHPHIRQIDYLQSIDNLPLFLETMDWRF